MLYKVVLTFESADEILKCDHSNETYLKSSVVLFVSEFFLKRHGKKVLKNGLNAFVMYAVVFEVVFMAFEIFTN